MSDWLDDIFDFGELDTIIYDLESLDEYVNLIPADWVEEASDVKSFDKIYNS